MDNFPPTDSTRHADRLPAMVGFVLLAGLLVPDAAAQMVQGAYAGNDPTLPVIDVYYYVGPIPVGKTEDVTSAEVSVDFIEVPSGVAITASVAEGNSTSVSEAFFSETITIDSDTNFVQIVNGLRNPAGFAANPDGRSLDIAVHQLDNVKRFAAHPDSFEVIVYHGSTDAPGVDVTLRGGAQLASGIMYGDRSPSYITLNAGEPFTVDVTRTSDAALLGSYVGLIPSGYAGRAGFLALRGFVDTTANPGGSDFVVTVVPSSGSAFDLMPESTTGLADDEPGELGGRLIQELYPNPATGTVNFRLGVAAENVEAQVYDILGRRLGLADSRPRYTAGSSRDGLIDVSALAPGVYLLKVVSTRGFDTRQFVVGR